MKRVAFTTSLLLPTLSMAAKTQVPLNGFNVYAYLDPQDSEYAIFKLEMKTGTWLGLGLGTKDMSDNSDMIMVDAAASQVLDMHSVGKRKPKKDGSQDLQFHFQKVDSESLNVTLRRALDTNDDKDFVLPLDSAFDLAWAVNIKTSNIEKVHQFRGAITFKIPSLSVNATNDFTDKKWISLSSTGGDDEDEMSWWKIVLAVCIPLLIILSLGIFFLCRYRNKHAKKTTKFDVITTE